MRYCLEGKNEDNVVTTGRQDLGLATEKVNNKVDFNLRTG